LDYWTNIFGFEGENSLLSALKHLGYAEGLSSGYNDVIENSSIIYISIDLTDEGLAKYMDVLDVVFAYL
jgi:insulysin